MTRHDTFPEHAIAQKDFILATDLDGTFLGGSDAERQHFYNWIEDNRPRVGLIFVTGRDPEHIRHLTQEKGVPRPDYAICDVGTTIAEVTQDHVLTPLVPLEEPIVTAWGDATDRVKQALHDTAGLTLQPTAFRHRVSYDLDPTTFDAQLLEVITDMGLDALVSDNRFLDVLPKGISKGPSLVRLLDHLGIHHAKTLVAGDTLNDLSMLELGLPAVAVGGSEEALRIKVAAMDHVHKADGIGVAGITEAILAHRLFTTPGGA